MFNSRDEVQSNWGGQMKNMFTKIGAHWSWKIYSYLVVLYILGFAAGVPLESN